MSPRRTATYSEQTIAVSGRTHEFETKDLNLVPKPATRGSPGRRGRASPPHPGCRPVQSVETLLRRGTRSFIYINCALSNSAKQVPEVRYAIVSERQEPEQPSLLSKKTKTKYHGAVQVLGF
jgi:hypothetical protein